MNKLIRLNNSNPIHFHLLNIRWLNVTNKVSKPLEYVLALPIRNNDYFHFQLRFSKSRWSAERLIFERFFLQTINRFKCIIKKQKKHSKNRQKGKHRWTIDRVIKFHVNTLPHKRASGKPPFLLFWKRMVLFSIFRHNHFRFNRRCLKKSKGMFSKFNVLWLSNGII